MAESTVILDAAAIGRALARIAHEIAERNEKSADVVLVGIPAGGEGLPKGWVNYFLKFGNTPFPSAPSMSPCTATIWTAASRPKFTPPSCPST
jgi:hypothetical protein